MSSSHAPALDIRAGIRLALAHFEHLLPGQAPIRDFVHHNTLHGFQHLPFPEALQAARELTGQYGYLPVERFRELFRQGRITRDDLARVLLEDPELAASLPLEAVPGHALRRVDLYLTTLLYPFPALTGCQLNWHIEELEVMSRFQEDVPQEVRERLITAASHQGLAGEAEVIGDLWGACLQVLGLESFLVHPEEMLDLSPTQAEQMLSQIQTQAAEDEQRPESLVRHLMGQEATRQLQELLQRVGRDLTLGGLLRQLTGRDPMQELGPLLVRYLGAFLDQGVAAWHPETRANGFFAFWQASAAQDLGWLIQDLPEWRNHLESLPDDPLDSLIAELRRMGLPTELWVGYLERLCLEWPGWSGLFLWRHRHPGYQGAGFPVEMLDYLAVRLALERIFAQRLCAGLWGVEASLDMIRWYFRHHPAEFMVRLALYTSRLPEYLVNKAQRLVNRPGIPGREKDRAPWHRVAQLIWTWRRSPAADAGERRASETAPRADNPTEHRVFVSGWRLFRLAQHLALPGAAIRAMGREGAEELLAGLALMDDERSGFLWLQAYEHHYRDQIFQAVLANHGRGPWRERRQRPRAQLLFCMDDREEGIRRHLEEIAPEVETLGAAGFFGVAMNWLGLDDRQISALCPVVVTPAHEIREVARPGAETRRDQRAQRRRWRRRAANLLFQESRRNLLSTGLAMLPLAPAALAMLAAKLIAPLSTGRLVERWRQGYEPEVPSDVAIHAGETAAPASPEQPRLGFTESEQADRVQGLLRSIGLGSGFARLVVILGHGSSSQNNPHRAAYDCGACSGRHGGPNARVFAAMANRPEVRQALHRRGMAIPADTWFLGAFHNTGNEDLQWFDLDRMPQALQPDFDRLRQDLLAATHRSAQERCRKFASAPGRPSPEAALAHVAARAYDFSQARPELGHATNAAAFIGRRAMSRGLFFDRRVFLISYDPTQDPDGRILEAILLAAGPVGAGINLEYYFSTVNNDGYGCGTKVTHNLNGFFGVMEGTSSDLRTGLPRQMIEIHEPMRLQVLVEADTEILSAIYQRQPPLQELIGHGWLLLAAKDPERPLIQVFRPGRGWEPWTGSDAELPRVATSADWYAGSMDPLPPALIDPGAVADHA